MADDVGKLKEALNSAFDSNSLTEFLNMFSIADTKLKALTEEANAVKKSISQIDTNINKLNSIKNKKVFENNTGNQSVKQQITSIDNLIEKYNQLKTQLSVAQTPEAIVEINVQIANLKDEFTQAVTGATQLQQKLKNASGVDNLSAKIKKLTADIQSYINANTRMMNSNAGTNGNTFANQLQGMLTQLQSASDSDTYNKIANNFRVVRSQVKAMGLEGETAFGSLMANAKKFATWMGMTSIISAATRSIRDMINNVVDLDTALTNLKKVTDETDATYSRFLKNASQQAKELHSTVTDLIEQTSQWAKLGYNLEQANKLAEASMIYANVGEVDNEQAVTNIVSAVKAFDIAVNNIMSIPDVYNKLGNEFAVSSKNLGVGMSQAATTMALAGNDFNQVAALLTGAGEILGDDRLDEIGTGLKTVTLRIQNQAGALKELGEEYEDLVSVSKTQQQIYELTGGKVNIMSATDPNEFRTTYNILKDVANVINDLNGTDASELVQLLFGKNRANVGTAVLKAFQSGQIEKAYEAAKNSAGSAQEEFDRWSQSIEAHINTFKASFESLSQTIIDSDLIKFIIDGGTSILNLLESIVDTVGTLGTIGLGAGIFAGVKNVGRAKVYVLN